MDEQIKAYIDQKIQEELDRREVRKVPLKQFCEEYQITRQGVHKAIRRGDIRAEKVGSKVFILLNQFNR